MVVIMSAFNGCRANTTLTGKKCVFYVLNEYFLSLFFFLLFYAYCVALTHTCTALATAGDPFVHCVYVRASSYPYMHSPRHTLRSMRSCSILFSLHRYTCDVCCVSVVARDPHCGKPGKCFMPFYNVHRSASHCGKNPCFSFIAFV